MIEDRFWVQFNDDFGSPLFALVDRWLFGSDAAVQMVGFMAVLVNVDTDIRRLEEQRVGSDLWKIFYGTPKTLSKKAERTEKIRLRNLAKNHDAWSHWPDEFYESVLHMNPEAAKLKRWSRYDDAANMRWAQLWVRSHHVYHNLHEALVDDVDPYIGFDMESKAIRKLAIFDHLFGRERRAGRRYDSSMYSSSTY